MRKELILTIDPQVDSTRIAIFLKNTPVFLKKIIHNPEELKKFKHFKDETKYRTDNILEELKENDVEIENIKLIFGRGGLVKPVKSGVYEVNEKLKKDLEDSKLGDDVVNLGGLIAYKAAKLFQGTTAFIADPVVVDELSDIARYTGNPKLKRLSIFHALSHKTAARKYSNSIDKKYQDLNLIVCHLGGGFSIGAHHKGRVIDVNQAYDGEGPFSPIRSGSLPMGDVIKMCYSGKYTLNEMLKMQTGEGGLYAYFKTFDIYDIFKMRDSGNKKASDILEAMAYQVSKTIGSMFPVFKDENVDAIIITGKLAKDDKIIQIIRNRVEKIAPVFIYPEYDTLTSLGFYGMLLLKKEIEMLEYK